MLIDHALRDRPALFFEALEGRPQRQQIEYFIRQLKRFAGHEVAHVRSWVDDFLQLHEAVRDQPQPIVFDELQGMANYRSDVVSELKYV
jgi:hypothetical protein